MDYRIKAVSAMLGVSDTSIRGYESDLGLKPRRQENGPKIRIYSEAEVFQLAAYRRSRPNSNLPTLPRQVVLSTFIPKGGVAKSTLTTELAVQFSLMGFRVLVVDIDPQASSTVIFGYEPEVEESEAADFNIRPDQVVRHNISELVPTSNVGNGAKGTVPLSEVLMKPYGEYGPHLIPADVTLSEFNWSLFQAANRERRIASWIWKSNKFPTEAMDLTPYDIIMFDNSPSSTALSRASLVAADYCISPVRLDALSAKSLSFVSRELTELQNSDLHSPGLIAIPTFYDSNTERSRQIIAGLDRLYRDVMTKKQLRQSEIFPRSLLKALPQDRMPVSLAQPLHPVVRDELHGIAAEIIERIRVELSDSVVSDRATDRNESAEKAN